MSLNGSAPRRIAVLSDVHANAVALRAVIADLDSHGAEEIVVAGDLIGFGPSPSEVVDLLVARGARVIRGNWEADYVAALATGVPDEWRADPNKAPLLWTLDRLGAERRAYLAALPDRLAPVPGDSTVLVVHGTPRSFREGVLPTTPDEEVVAAFAGESAALCFVGHTHLAMDRVVGNRRVVNPGSVGLPTDGDSRAAYALVDLSADGDTLAVEQRRVAYDLDAAIAAYDGGLREVAPWFVQLLERQLRTARNLYALWLKESAGLSVGEFPAAMARFLASND
jgi:predicted phosphodiesterase